MTEYVVGKGGEFATLTAALAAVKPGDTVRIRAGVYRETVRITTNNLTILGEDGAILDGGYSHEWAKIKGTGWRDLQYKAPPAGSKSVVGVQANGITIDGLHVRNSPDSGIAAGAVDGLTVRNCSFDHLYRTGIQINGTTGTATNILIEGNYVNAASTQIFNPGRDQSRSQRVSGAIKVGNAKGVIVRRNVVVNGFGEGFNGGKNLWEFVFEDNYAFDCNHKHFYNNSAVDGVVRNNVAVCTGHPAHLWTRGRAPAGYAIVDETPRTPFSRNIVWEGNLAVNMGVPFQAVPRDKAGAFEVRNNTFVYGPLTRSGPQIKGGKTTVRNNIFAVLPDATPTGAPTTLGPNLWSTQPPRAWRHAGDVVGNPLFVNPAIPGGPHDPYGLVDNVTFAKEWYELRPSSPAVRDGVAVFGALGMTGSEPPDEPDPPVDPPDDPDPEPEPPAIDADAIFAELAIIREAADEIERLLGDVESGDA